MKGMIRTGYHGKAEAARIAREQSHYATRNQRPPRAETPTIQKERPQS